MYIKHTQQPPQPQQQEQWEKIQVPEMKSSSNVGRSLSLVSKTDSLPK
jgi:hypothetical protein